MQVSLLFIKNETIFYCNSKEERILHFAYTGIDSLWHWIVADYGNGDFSSWKCWEKFMPSARCNCIFSIRIILELGKEVSRKKIIMNPPFSHFKTKQCHKKTCAHRSETSKLRFLPEHQRAKPKQLLEVLRSQNLAKIKVSFRKTSLCQLNLSCAN